MRLHAAQVPTTDYDRSIAFYTALGFATRLQVDMGEHRWVELAPEGGEAGVALVPALPDQTPVALIVSVDDLAAAHAELVARGLDVDAEIAQPGSSTEIEFGAITVAGPSPAMFYVRDPDGNRLLVV